MLNNFESEEQKMREIKVTFSNGNYLYTKINGSEETIKDYYLGKTFTVAYERVVAVSVEFLN